MEVITDTGFDSSLDAFPYAHDSVTTVCSTRLTEPGDDTITSVVPTLDENTPVAPVDDNKLAVDVEKEE